MNLPPQALKGGISPELKAGIKQQDTAKTEIIENATLTLDLPFPVRSAVLPEGRRVFLTVFYLPNLKGEILDVLAPFSIISVFAVRYCICTGGR